MLSKICRVEKIQRRKRYRGGKDTEEKIHRQLDGSIGGSSPTGGLVCYGLPGLWAAVVRAGFALRPDGVVCGDLRMGLGG